MIAVDDFHIGNQAGSRAFVHVEVAECVAVVLRRRLPRPAGLDVQLSVDIVDMDCCSHVNERLANLL